MQLITHQKHINKTIPDTLLNYIIKRYQQLAEENDAPPIITLVKPDDMIIPTMLSSAIEGACSKCTKISVTTCL